MADIHFDLDKTLLDLSSKHFTAEWTIGDAVEGLQIFGGIGSGKTSGSGRTVALKYLLNNFGGLVLCAKHDEKALWEEYCRMTGRLDDLIVVEPGGHHHFNFLEYESVTSKGERSLTMNIVQVLKTVIRAGQEHTGKGTDDAFWQAALDMLLANTIDLCLQAYGRVTVQDLYDIAQAAPRPPVKNINSNASQQPQEKKNDPFRDTFNLAMAKVEEQVAGWKALLSASDISKIKDNRQFTSMAADALPDVRIMGFVNNFFTETYRNIAEKTRSIIDFSLLGFLYNLLKEPVYSLFCRYSSNFTPEDCLKGKIILLNLPVKDYHKIGRDAQIMFKYIWQRAMERRRIGDNDRPVFLWADEAQHFLHEHDAAYQATARSSRIATVYISQNLPNYFANMGGKEGEFRVKSFLGTLGTKIFHANADIETNRYASELIGKAYAEDTSKSVAMAKEFSSSRSMRYTLEQMVRPEEFVSLKTGRRKNGYIVEGYVHLQGNQPGDQFNHSLIKFSQHFKP